MKNLISRLSWLIVAASMSLVPAFALADSGGGGGQSGDDHHAVQAVQILGVDNSGPGNMNDVDADEDNSGPGNMNDVVAVIDNSGPGNMNEDNDDDDICFVTLTHGLHHFVVDDDDADEFFEDADELFEDLEDCVVIVNKDAVILL